MTAWTERLDLGEKSRVLRRALADGWFDGGANTAVFHHLSPVRARIAELTAAFPASALHAVAVKANPVVELSRAVVLAGAGLEAASSEEVHLALAAGCPHSRVVFDSPAKTRAELEAALAPGIHVNADNVDELERIGDILRERRSGSVIGLRVNPLVEGGAIAATNVATRSSKFGVPIDIGLDALTALFSRYPWLTGLHVHSGSQGSSMPMLASAVAKVAGTMRELDRRLGGARVTTLDIGGGLPIAYRDGDPAPTPAEYAAALREAAPAIFEPPIRLITEMGRSIHASAGWAASRVEYVKSAGDERLAVIHLGADFLLRRAYQPDVWHHELDVLTPDGRPKGGASQPFTIVGPLCFAGDVVARGVLLPSIEPGDFVVISDTGAYTMGMWSRHCSRAMPPVLGWDGDHLSVLRARETPADVVAFWSAGSGRAPST